MKTKILLITLSVFFAGAAFGTLWYGSQVVGKESELLFLQAYVKEGAALMGKGRGDDAKQYFSIANRAFPKALERVGYYFEISDAYYHAGHSLFRLHQTRAANETYFKGLQYDPASITLLFASGESYEKLGMWVEAIKQFRLLNQIKPEPEIEKRLARLITQKKIVQKQ